MLRGSRWLFCLLLLGAPRAAVAVELPSLNALAEALRRGDAVESERLARRLGPSRLGRVAESDAVPRLRRAALEALPLLDDAWAVLPRVIALAGTREPQLSQAAARAARRIAEELTPERVERDEVPPDVPRRAQALLVRLVEPELPGAAASDRARDPARDEVRAEALRAAVRLGALVPLEARVLETLVRDPAAAVRRVAAAALAPAAAGALLERLLEEEGEGSTRALATLACDLGPGALAAPLTQRLRSRAQADKARPESAELERCLPGASPQRQRKPPGRPRPPR